MNYGPYIQTAKEPVLNHAKTTSPHPVCEITPARQTSLELLAIVDTVCNKHDVAYTLFGNSLAGLHYYDGFLPNSPNITLGLLYPEYLRLLELLEEHYPAGSLYYLRNHDNTAQFSSVETWFLRRSNVVLPEDREQDEMYYDCYIALVPIFFAGDTVQELRHIHKMCSQYAKKLMAQAPLDYAFTRLSHWVSIPRHIRYWKNKKQYNKKQPDDFDNMMATLVRCQGPSKFVYFPGCDVNKRSMDVCFLSTMYSRGQLTRIRYMGVECSVLRQYPEWVQAHYSRRWRNKISNAPINRAALAGPETLRRIQLIQLEMMLEVDRICRAHHIPYSLMFGSLLGAVRHKGFIPWDDDVDIIMPYGEYKRFCEIAAQELDSDRFFLKTQDTDDDDNLTFTHLKRNGTVCCKENRKKFQTHNGVNIDIFPLYKAPSSRIKRWFQGRACRFLRIVVWAHMGAENERKPLKRWYYRQLSKINHKSAFALFEKLATKYEDSGTEYVYLSNGLHSPRDCGFSHLDFFDSLREIVFENHLFWVGERAMEAIIHYYTKDYSQYPPLAQRVAQHLPYHIDLGEISPLESPKFPENRGSL